MHMVQNAVYHLASQEYLARILYSLAHIFATLVFAIFSSVIIFFLYIEITIMYSMDLRIAALTPIFTVSFVVLEKFLNLSAFITVRFVDG